MWYTWFLGKLVSQTINRTKMVEPNFYNLTSQPRIVTELIVVFPLSFNFFFDMSLFSATSTNSLSRSQASC